MKPPSWSVLCLATINAAGALCLFGLWWANWPRSTAYWFLDRLAQGEVAETNPALRNARWYCADGGATLMLQIPDEPGSTQEWHFYPLTAAHVPLFKFEPRGITDLFLGRLRLLQVNKRGQPNNWMNGKPVHLVVERGKITYRLIRCPDETNPFEMWEHTSREFRE